MKTQTGLVKLKKVALISVWMALEESFKDVLTFSCGIKKQVEMAARGNKVLGGAGGGAH